MLRHFFQVFVGASLAVLLPAVVQAADYPNRPIKVVVPFAAAGVTDIVARVVFERVSRSVGQTIVIDNRPGAGGTIGVEQVVNAPPDGYTLIMADPSGSLPANVTLYPNLKYHPLRNLAPIAIFGTTGAVLLVTTIRCRRTAPGPGRARQEQAGRADVRVDRHRDARPSQRRAVQPARRHQDRARALSRRRTGGDRSRRRPHLVLDRADPDHAAKGPARAASAARGRGRVALHRSARHPDRQGDRHRRLRRLDDLCGVRARRHAERRSSTSCTPRSNARSTTRPCSRSCAPAGVSSRGSARPRTMTRCCEGASRNGRT